MKNILGLDLGTNSIGWAVISHDGMCYSGIKCAGSRIIPMDAATMGDFDKGVTKSSASERTQQRGIRRLNERSLLRRERLHRVLDIMGFLPEHYSRNLTRYGKFISEKVKLAWTDEGRFLFDASFNEMLHEFRSQHPSLMESGKKIPYDWTVYYLRKKALSYPINKFELAWILLNFNQKRGYYQLRGEEDDEKASNKQEEYMSLKVLRVEDSGEKSGKYTWYRVHLDNGMIYNRKSNIPLDWVGKERDFIITTELNNDGTPKTDKEGNFKRSFRSPSENDWTLIKKKTEADIEKSQKTVGTYIYESLLQNPTQKIRGKLVRVVERKFYRSELKLILEKQCRFLPELQDAALLQACLEELYPHNRMHRDIISNKGFTSLFIDDIIFYQRPLKSKKSLIGNCPYEWHSYVDKTTGKTKTVYNKCIAKSHPLYQEFRLWQFLSNLRIYSKGTYEQDVTTRLLPDQESYAALFSWLNDRTSIRQKDFLNYSGFKLTKTEQKNYRWNYVEDKTYPCNETRGEILKRILDCNLPEIFLTKERELSLWHILYSVEDKEQYKKALEKFAEKNSIDSADFVAAFEKATAFKKDYGSYSAKAISRLLPLMRRGRFWSEEKIDKNTLERIEKLINGEYDEQLCEQAYEGVAGLSDVSQFQGLPVWLACYIVYNRHSEATDVSRWESPDDIDKYLSDFRQHSLRNPIVEQVVLECLRTVRDIWRQVGHIDEIHVELGREMKNPADKRKKMTESILENEKANLRAKAMLMELINPEMKVEGVRPHSPGQQELFRIYEENVLNSEKVPDDITEILAKFNQTDNAKRPTSSEVNRYRLWLDQKYRSPYTGEMISLSKLFTSAYEIEHIIPQSRYFDDSFSNKVICESEVNKLKSNLLGHEFIKKHQGEKVQLSMGKTVEILSVEAYEKFVNEHYSYNRVKKEKLLMDDIPEKFIERQMNDSRYISKLVKALLSNIVREEGEKDATSKNVISCTGGITDRLKKDWGINDVWNGIILPRFIRMNEIDKTNSYTAINTSGNIIPDMPFEYQRGFSKKRIDHRHHAMDAIVIACASRNVVNYLNNSSAAKESEAGRMDLRNKLCNKNYTDDKGNYKWIIRKPWETFTQDVKETLQDIVVSFKQNLRIINKSSNRTLHFEEGKKKLQKQTKGDNWAIRKPMHKDTVYGEVNLQRTKEVSFKEALKPDYAIVNRDLRKKVLSLQASGYDVKQMMKYFESEKDVWQDVDFKKIKVRYFTKTTNDRYFATRKPIDSSFNKKKIEESITDTGIQKIMLRHLENMGGNPELAFSSDGLDEMNKNIRALNNGRFHQPVYKVRIYEKADKYAIGEKGQKAKKFVEAAKGTNLFFAIYENETVDKSTGEILRKRSFTTIPMNIVMNRLKQGLSPVPANDCGKDAKYVLSPNDLVYVPTKDELERGVDGTTLDKDRIYKMVSSNNYQCFFVKNSVASPIVNKMEFSSQNKMERAVTGEMIKEICIPLKVDRLGNIIKMG